jgi:hypothetical protein
MNLQGFRLRLSKLQTGPYFFALIPRPLITLWTVNDAGSLQETDPTGERLLFSVTSDGSLSSSLP